eukprot:CAMPEP_0203846224 /NCGR_PEP_ID=MMETSP0359-20131031/4295_1 /ASSEMBLY_ACC=CAM_ASM_000338 /TAXON_ID=268821 /ORGANISM="Scrippsiella Hangoei, Strain SHTV-5" /LENGTH=149 /DNA_ID=CAMNT_0050761507 /DNA_START=95 /DNA_END=541 /DNA_ORIENTATION=+
MGAGASVGNAANQNQLASPGDAGHAQEMDDFLIEVEVVRSETERRVASDGNTYTRKDYEAKFGSDGWESTKEPEQDDRPPWTIQAFLGADLGKLVAEALTPPSAKDHPEEELALFRALGRKGSVSLVKKMLDEQDTLTKLATHIMESAQ